MFHSKDKTSEQITFDGSGLRLIDFKRAIIEKKQIKSTLTGVEVDFKIWEQSDVEKVYEDDLELIPRNASVVVRKVPGKSKRDNKPQPMVTYIDARVTEDNALPSDRPEAIFDSSSQPLIEPPLKAIEILTNSTVVQSSIENISKPAIIASPVQNPLYKVDDSESLEEQRLMNIVAEPVHDRRLFPSTYGERPARPQYNVQASHAPSYIHAGYVCRRCGVEGHHIKNCPTNGDPAFDPQGKIMNKLVNVPKVLMSKITNLEDIDTTHTTVIKNADGTFSAFQPSIGGLEKIVNQSEWTFAVDLENLEDVPPELQCPLNKKILSEAVLLPCCLRSVNDSAIQQELLSSGLKCPLCNATKVSPDSLIVSKEVRAEAQKFVASASAKRKIQTQTGATTTNEEAMMDKMPAMPIPSLPSTSIPVAAPSSAPITLLPLVLPFEPMHKPPPPPMAPPPSIDISSSGMSTGMSMSSVGFVPPMAPPPPQMGMFSTGMLPQHIGGMHSQGQGQMGGGTGTFMNPMFSSMLPNMLGPMAMTNWRSAADIPIEVLPHPLSEEDFAREKELMVEDARRYLEGVERRKFSFNPYRGGGTFNAGRGDRFGGGNYGFQGGGDRGMHRDNRPQQQSFDRFHGGERNAPSVYHRDKPVGESDREGGIGNYYQPSKYLKKRAASPSLSSSRSRSDSVSRHRSSRSRSRSVSRSRNRSRSPVTAKEVDKGKGGRDRRKKDLDKGKRSVSRSRSRSVSRSKDHKAKERDRSPVKDRAGDRDRDRDRDRTRTRDKFVYSREEEKVSASALVAVDKKASASSGKRDKSRDRSPIEKARGSRQGEEKSSREKQSKKSDRDAESSSSSGIHESKKSKPPKDEERKDKDKDSKSRASSDKHKSKDKDKDRDREKDKDKEKDRGERENKDKEKSKEKEKDKLHEEEKKVKHESSKPSSSTHRSNREKEKEKEGKTRDRDRDDVESSRDTDGGSSSVYAGKRSRESGGSAQAQTSRGETTQAKKTSGSTGRSHENHSSRRSRSASPSRKSAKKGGDEESVHSGGRKIEIVYRHDEDNTSNSSSSKQKSSNPSSSSSSSRAFRPSTNSNFSSKPTVELSDRR